MDDFRLLGYNASILKKCCGWVDTRHRKDVWRFVFNYFERVGNNFVPFIQVEGLKIEAEKEGN